jgi:hypothetical protein
MPNNDLSPEEIAAARKLLARLGGNVGAPPPRPRSMTPEQYDAHVAAADAETARNAEHDENPRAFALSLADRIDAIEEHLGIDEATEAADGAKAKSKKGAKA